jgi:hypothetical protein
MNTRSLFAGLATLLLAACQSTMVESLPTGATASCPPEWRGAWIGLDADTGEAEDAGFLIAADCATTMIERHEGKLRETHFSPRFAQVDATRIVFVGHEEAASQYKQDPPARAGWYPFAWERHGEVLALHPPDHRRIATLIVNGALEGATTWDRDEGANFVHGDAQAIERALRGPLGFDGGDGFRMRRVGEDRKALERAIARVVREDTARERRESRNREREPQ